MRGKRITDFKRDLLEFRLYNYHFFLHLRLLQERLSFRTKSKLGLPLSLSRRQRSSNHLRGLLLLPIPRLEYFAHPDLHLLFKLNFLPPFFPCQRPPPPPTVFLQQILPRRRSYSPPAKYLIPEWIPANNYRPASSPPLEPPSIPMPLSSSYTTSLPRLPPIPINPAKRHKKSKDDRGMYKLQLQYSLNPLSGGLSRSSKCVLTSDWKIAQAEIRHIRALERIEAKKMDGRWSLRQPKKLRGPPVPKAHWDYLLEEMVRDRFSIILLY